jgi:hypothetical protein
MSSSGVFMQFIFNLLNVGSCLSGVKIALKAKGSLGPMLQSSHISAIMSCLVSSGLMST